MLRDLLIARLTQTFGANAFTPGDLPDLIAIFPSAHPDVGPAEIWDHDGGALVSLPHITHGHFDDYAKGMTDKERLSAIADDVTEFLQDLFADKYVLWKSAEGGGWWPVGYHAGVVPEWATNVQIFRWSGPRSTADERTFDETLVGTGGNGRA